VARPVSIQNEAILEAARRVFLEHGYKASTALIARKARVSQGSLFKHFGSKNELFCEAMRAESGMQKYEDDLLKLAGKGDIQTTLEKAGRQLLKHMQIVLPRVMTMCSSGVSMPTYDRTSGRPPPRVLVDALARYFREEIRLGGLNVEAPEILAHVIVAGLTHYVICDVLHHYRPGPPAAYVRTLVQVVLYGSLSPGAPAGKKGKRVFSNTSAPGADREGKVGRSRA